MPNDWTRWLTEEERTLEKLATDVVAPDPPPIPDGSPSYRRWQVYSATPKLLRSLAACREECAELKEEIMETYCREHQMVGPCPTCFEKLEVEVTKLKTLLGAYHTEYLNKHTGYISAVEVQRLVAERDASRALVAEKDKALGKLLDWAERRMACEVCHGIYFEHNRRLGHHEGCLVVKGREGEGLTEKEMVR